MDRRKQTLDLTCVFADNLVHGIKGRLIWVMRNGDQVRSHSRCVCQQWFVARERATQGFLQKAFNVEMTLRLDNADALPTSPPATTTATGSCGLMILAGRSGLVSI